MTNPDISILIPVYNSDRFIGQALASIDHYTELSIEIIVINDASTDLTFDIVSHLSKSDPRIVLVSNHRQKGIAGALNSGLDIAKGRYIARFDADDLNRKDRFRSQFLFLEQHKHIQCCGGGYAAFNNLGTRITVHHPSNPIIIALRFVTNTYFCHPTTMMRREVFDHVSGYIDVEAEDFVFFSNVVYLFPCTNLPQILIDYRESESNRSHKKAIEIARSVKHQARQNYIKYIENDRLFDVFFEYQHDRLLAISDLFSAMLLNLRIIMNVRKRYTYSAFGLSFINAIFFSLIDPIRVLSKK